MQISTETVGRLYASGRNYVNLVIGFASGIGIMSASQQKGLMDSLTEIYNGISQIVHGATSAWQILAVVAAPIIGPILARWASNTAKTSHQVASVQAAVNDPNTNLTTETKAAILTAATALPEVKPEATKIVVSDPVLANAVPSNNVVAK